jgi:hypothetical protein
VQGYAVRREMFFLEYEKGGAVDLKGLGDPSIPASRVGGCFCRTKRMVGEGSPWKDVDIPAPCLMADSSMPLPAREIIKPPTDSLHPFNAL